MGIIQEHVKGMRNQVGKVVNSQFFQGVYHGSRVAGGFHGKPVGLELVFAGSHLGQNSQEKVQGRIEQAEKYQPGIDRGLFQEKGVEQALVGHEKGEQKKHDAGLDHSNQHALEDVLFFIMPHFMGQDGQEFIHGVLFDKGVEQHDALVFTKPREKGIGLARPLGTVHDKDIGQGILDGLGVSKDALPELAFFQGGKLVEERHNPGGGDKLDEQHVKRHHCPAKEPGFFPGIFKKRQNARQEGRAQENRQDKALEKIHHVGPEGGFVESKAFLDHESGIQGKGLGQKSVRQHQHGDVYEAGDHRPLTQGPGPVVEQGDSAAKPETEHDQGIKQCAGPSEACVDLKVVLGSCIALRIEDALKGIGNLVLDHLQVQSVGHQVQQQIQNKGQQNDDGNKIHKAYARHQWWIFKTCALIGTPACRAITGHVA